MTRRPYYRHLATGIQAPHHEPLPICRGLIDVPTLFQAPAEGFPQFDLTVAGPHELTAEGGRKSYVISGLGIRVINALIVLGEEAHDRQLWFPYGALRDVGAKEGETYIPLSSVALKRVVDAFEVMRYDIDGSAPGVIERSAHGSGSNPEYRIYPGTAFLDKRPSNS